MFDEKRLFAPTTCLECVIQVVAFKDEDPRMNSIHISALSSSYHMYNRTWKGRLRNAWFALKANPNPDIDLMTNEDIAEFRNVMSEIYTWLYDKNKNKKKD